MPRRTAHRSRPRPALLAILLVTLVFAGCVQQDPGGAGDREAASPNEGNERSATDETEAPAGGDADTAEDHAASDDDTNKGRNDTRTAPEDRDPAPPEDAEVATEDDLDRPGEYTMRPYRADRRTDVRLDVPTWTKGDTWRYEHDHLGWDFACTFAEPPVPPTQHPVQSHLVQGTKTIHGLEAYELTLTYTDCAGRKSDPFTMNRTRADLEPIDREGFSGHHLLFPLEDGKRWVFLDRFSKKVGVEVTYEAAYEWDGGTGPAWHLVSTTESGQTSWTHRWFVADVENVVKLEIRVEEADATECIDMVDGECVAYRETLIDHDVA